MKLGIFYNKSNKDSVVAVGKLKTVLEDNKMEFCELEESICNQKLVSDVDLLIVFGGDGSVLRAVKYALDKIPMVAINTGNLGFLTSYEKQELQAMVDAVKGNSLKFSSRRLLKVCFGDSVAYALNDAVINYNHQENHQSGCIKLKLKIDGHYVDKYVADGIVFSTPTGSTAYALSAGGPVLTPDLDVIVAAPICPHSLHSRPIVFSGKSTATIKVCEDSKQCTLYVDGTAVCNVSAGNVFSTTLSEKTVKICDSKMSFFERLNKKIISWSSCVEDSCDDENGGKN